MKADEKSHQINLDKIDLGRQATRSIGGYVYQLYQSLIAWLQLKDNEVLVLEVAEDYATIVGDTINQVQVKDIGKSTNVTLRSEGVVSLIESHWRLRKSEPNKKVISAFLTTADIGREHQLVFPNNARGLEYWRTAARKDADVTPLKDAFQKIGFSAELKLFARESSDEDFQEALLRSIKWITSADNLDGVQNSVRDALVYLGETKDCTPHESIQTEYRLIGELIERIVNPTSKRSLSRADLLQIFEEATSTMIPRTALREVMLLVETLKNNSPVTSEIAHSLNRVSHISVPPRLTLRRDLVTELARLTQQEGFLWLHGSSGLGKTLLAILVARTSTADWMFVDLRECTTLEQLRVRLSMTAQTMRSSDLGGVILDDYPIHLYDAAIQNLAQLVSEVSQLDSTVVVTSSRSAPPLVLSRLGKTQASIVAVPYLTETDVAEMVVAGGGNPEIWAKALHLFSGGGHPSIVDARIFGLMIRNWPESELLDDIAPTGSGVVELKSQRESLILQLRSVISAEEREFLYRLSVVSGGFDRALATAIAETSPPLNHPQELFTALHGPWLESRGENTYLVSPLVAAAGIAQLNEPEKSAVRKSLLKNLTSRSVFPVEQLSQVLLFGILERDRGSLVWFSLLMMKSFVENSQEFAKLSQYLSAFPYFNGERLFGADAAVSVMLRSIQCLVALSIQSTQTADVLTKLLDECKDTTDELSNGFFVMCVTKALLDRSYSLTPKVWLPLLLKLEQAISGSPNLSVYFSNLKTIKEFDGLSPGQTLFEIQASATEDLEQLTELFAQLEKLEGNKRSEFLHANENSIASRRLMINTAWLNESKADKLQPRLAAERYESLIKICKTWHDQELEIDCIAAQAIVLDEYGDDSEMALKIIDSGLTSYPDDMLLLRRKQVILFRMGNHIDSLNIFLQMTDRLNELLKVDKVYALRDAAISFARTHQFEDAQKTFSEASIFAYEGKETMQDMAAGLLAEAALIAFKLNKFNESARLLKDAFIKLEKTVFKNLEICRHWDLRLLAVVNHLWAPGDDEPLIGACSNPKIDLDVIVPDQLHTITKWYLLADFERKHALKSGAFEELQLRTQTECMPLMEHTITRQLISQSMADGDSDKFYSLLARYLQILQVVENEDAQKMLNIFAIDMTFDLSSLLNSSHDVFAIDAILAFSVIDVIRFSGDHIDELAGKFEQFAQTNASLGKFFAILTGKSAAEADDSERFVWAQIVNECAKAKGKLGAKALFFACCHIMEWLRVSRFKQDVECILADYLSDGWKRVITDGRFALNSPNVYCPAIEEVLVGPQVGLAKIAALTLVSNGATHFRIDESYQQRLRSFIKN